VNGEAIYATQASPLPVLPWGECTCKKVKKHMELFLSVFDWPKDGKLTVPGLENRVISAMLLATGEKLKTTATACGIVISLPGTTPDPVAGVIKLVVKGKITCSEP